MCLSDEGKVYGFGGNYYGQIGYDPKTVGTKQCYVGDARLVSERSDCMRIFAQSFSSAIVTRN